MSVTVVERARVAALVLREQLLAELKSRATSTRRAIPLGVLRGKEGMGRAVDTQIARMDTWMIEHGIDDALVEQVHRDGDAMWMGIAFLNDLLLELDEADQRVVRPWLAPPLPDVPDHVLQSIVGADRLAAFQSDATAGEPPTDVDRTLAHLDARAGQMRQAGERLLRGRQRR